MFRSLFLLLIRAKEVAFDLGKKGGIMDMEVNFDLGKKGGIICLFIKQIYKRTNSNRKGTKSRYIGIGLD